MIIRLAFEHLFLPIRRAHFIPQTQAKKLLVQHPLPLEFHIRRHVQSFTLTLPTALKSGKNGVLGVAACEESERRRKTANKLTGDSRMIYLADLFSFSTRFSNRVECHHVETQLEVTGLIVDVTGYHRRKLFV